MELPSICLNVIMKNESHVLERMLTSVLPIIDCYAIVDTGSTDNSKEVVKNFFLEKNIPGDIYDYEFTDYSDTRNYAISKAKGKATFIFRIDCDEQLFLPTDFNIKTLKRTLCNFDVGNITVYNNGLEYNRLSFFRTSKDFYFEGVVHEQLICNQPFTQTIFTDIINKVYAEGHSWLNIKDKYRKHAELLLKEVLKYNKPRDVFYLAQSYKDAGDIENSIHWYTVRTLQDNGSFEEKYYSQFMVGVLTEQTNLPFENKLMEHLKAHVIDYVRGEHILNTIVYLQSICLYEFSYIFSLYAMEKYHKNNPYPNRQLFIDKDTYEFKIQNCHNLNLEKTNRMTKTTEVLSIETLYNNLCNTPSDINQHLPKLKECAEKYGRCTEVGVRWVCSTYALMMGKPTKLISYDLNYHPNIEMAKHMALVNDIDFEFKQANILEVEIEETDFLFLDSLHTYEQVSQELKLHGNKVMKAIAFHDTVTFGAVDEVETTNPQKGILLAIAEFLTENNDWKFTYNSMENNGLIIIEKL